MNELMEIRRHCAELLESYRKSLEENGDSYGFTVQERKGILTYAVVELWKIPAGRSKKETVLSFNLRGRGRRGIERECYKISMDFAGWYDVSRSTNVGPYLEDKEKIISYEESAIELFQERLVKWMKVFQPYDLQPRIMLQWIDRKEKPVCEREKADIRSYKSQVQFKMVRNEVTMVVREKSDDCVFPELEYPLTEPVIGEKHLKLNHPDDVWEWLEEDLKYDLDLLESGNGLIEIAEV